ncbi:MAG TPA: hypothetical protein GX717_00880, partial [Clostridiaceae bacterium]|nr:hypothetical protein [Clostridiaceae bacterium]
QAFDIKCEEAVSSTSVQNIIKAQANVAIVRFHESEMLSYMKIFREHDIVYTKIWEYDYVVRIAATDPLANKEVLEPKDLKGYNEVIHAHRTANMFLPDHESSGAIGYHKSINRIYVNDRSNQLNIVRSVPKTFMWGAPDTSLFDVDEGLVQKPFDHESLHYHEWLIHRRNYQLTDLECRFMEILEGIVTNKCCLKRDRF